MTKWQSESSLNKPHGSHEKWAGFPGWSAGQAGSLLAEGCCGNGGEESPQLPADGVWSSALASEAKCTHSAGEVCLAFLVVAWQHV